MSEALLADTRTALESMRATLAADGYELKASVAPEQVVLVVEATADACEECLIPRSLFQMMAESALTAAGLDLRGRTLMVKYPPGHPDEAPAHPT
jgi:hypothetical protein